MQHMGRVQVLQRNEDLVRDPLHVRDRDGLRRGDELAQVEVHKVEDHPQVGEGRLPARGAPTARAPPWGGGGGGGGALGGEEGRRRAMRWGGKSEGRREGRAVTGTGRWVPRRPSYTPPTLGAALPVAEDSQLAQDTLRLSGLREGTADLLDRNLVCRVGPCLRVASRPHLAVCRGPGQQMRGGRRCPRDARPHRRVRRVRRRRRKDCYPVFAARQLTCAAAQVADELVLGRHVTLDALEEACAVVLQVAGYTRSAAAAAA
eukprot:scaffold5901_cov90-Isochrysis_galbana.AAC.2